MKTRNLLLIVAFCLMVAVAAAPPEASAAADWYECNVNLIGQWADGYVPLQLTHVGGAFTDKWFSVPSAKSKEYQAVILTAISTNKTVVIYTDPALPGNPEITAINLLNK